jgi:hypothetical protein
LWTSAQAQGATAVEDATRMSGNKRTALLTEASTLTYECPKKAMLRL